MIELTIRISEEATTAQVTRRIKGDGKVTELERKILERFLPALTAEFEAAVGGKVVRHEHQPLATAVGGNAS